MRPAGAELSEYSLDAIVATREHGGCWPQPSKPRSTAMCQAWPVEVDEHGRRLVVRNGHAEPRSLVTGAGPLEVRAPRVNYCRVDEGTGERMRFASSILPPWARKSPKVAEGAPLDVPPRDELGGLRPLHLEEFFGSAAGLSASVVTRLYHRVAEGAGLSSPTVRSRTSTTSTSGPTGSTSTSASRRLVCAPWSSWVSGPTGPRSWCRSATDTESPPSPGPTSCGVCRRRGMAAPVLAVGDGALGFWESVGRGLPRHRPPAVLGAQDGQRDRCVCPSRPSPPLVRHYPRGP